MIKYFENGFLALDGKMVMKLTDISLSYQVDTDEVHTFDDSWSKAYEYAYAGWTASGNGILTDDNAEIPKFSGETSITGVTSGLDALEATKARVKYSLILKIDSANYQKGTVLLTGCDISGAVGSKMTYSINLQGSGLLTKYAS